jgi:peptidyl-prolyl cis-trans isomerase C
MRVMVDGMVIGPDAIHAEMQYHPAKSVAEAEQRAAEALVLKALLDRAARAAGLGDDAEAIDRLLAREVAVVEPDEAACHRYFDANKERFRAPDLYEAQHILCAAPPDDGPARAAARAKAERLLATVRRAPDRFGAEARAHSDCPSASNEGHLGQVTRGSLVAELETYLFSLEAGEICPKAVETRYGWHVLRANEKAAGALLPYAHVRARIRDYLRERDWRRAVSAYLKALMTQAVIEHITDGPPPASPDMAAVQSP